MRATHIRRFENMCPVIRISDDLYERLAKLAAGFDTPANVIERLVMAFEEGGALANGQVQNSTATAAQINEPMRLIESGFQAVFQVEPRSFGQKASVWVGFSDDAKGVQWNLGIHRETGAAFLGVNLEGMKYVGWPIARLLVRERDAPELPDLTSLPSADMISVQFSRDAWQAAARPNIVERDIKGSGTALAQLTPSLWADMVEEALGCLDPRQGYKGRGQQTVTLIKSDEEVLKAVSPHLNIRSSLWNSIPDSLDEVIERIELARARLQPIYDFVRNRSEA
jgi:hypothetical protein